MKFFKKRNKTLKYIERLALENIENTGKTVAFFYMNSQDQAVVRASDDYIPKMIELAGGRYIFSDLKQKEDSN